MTQRSNGHHRRGTRQNGFATRPGGDKAMLEELHRVVLDDVGKHPSLALVLARGLRQVALSVLEMIATVIVVSAGIVGWSLIALAHNLRQLVRKDES